MKICFVQPDTDYQIKKNRHALALTFPQLISDLEIEQTDYCVYVAGKSTCAFDIFLVSQGVTHVFITAITSTFPYAIEFARIAQEKKCITVLGGLFASINYNVITHHYNCFDYIIAGKPNSDILIEVQQKPSVSKSIVSLGYSNYKKELGRIITDQRFTEIYDKHDTVCYELANGCLYNCSFCTMRKAFPNHSLQKRKIDIIQRDIARLAQYWTKLKIIDDDISLSINCLKQLNFHGFQEVIAETRLDHISEASMSIFQKVGITHLIVGVESLDTAFLKNSNKTSAPSMWSDRMSNAITLCVKYNIIMRPVLMIVNPTMSIEHLKLYENKLENWIPENNIELLCSFYTPHPGMGTPAEYRGLLTYNLKYFDHLHCVWLPPHLGQKNCEIISSIYNNVVNITKSSEYNPPIDFFFEDGEGFRCFFEMQGDIK